MRTLKAQKSYAKIEKHAVQKAQLFRKFKRPRFRAKPNDVFRHQSDKRARVLRLPSNVSLLFVYENNTKVETIPSESVNQISFWLSVGNKQKFHFQTRFVLTNINDKERRQQFDCRSA